MTSAVPQLLSSALRQRSPRLLMLALDLAIPPLSLLAIVWSMTGAAAVAWGILTENAWFPLSVLLIGTSSFALTLVAWHRYDAQSAVLPLLLALPAYAVSKVPIYLGFLLRRKRAWVRTPREPNPTPHLSMTVPQKNAGRKERATVQQ